MNNKQGLPPTVPSRCRGKDDDEDFSCFFYMPVKCTLLHETFLKHGHTHFLTLPLCNRDNNGPLNLTQIMIFL